MIAADGERLKGRRAAGPVHGLPLRQHPERLHEGLFAEVPAHHEPADGGPGPQPDITRGTLEGQIHPGAATFFRLQGTADSELVSYVAEGEILDIDPQTSAGSACSRSRTSRGSTATC